MNSRRKRWEKQEETGAAQSNSGKVIDCQTEPAKKERVRKAEYGEEVERAGATNREGAQSREKRGRWESRQKVVGLGRGGVVGDVEAGVPLVRGRRTEG